MRDQYETRTIYLRSTEQIDILLKLIPNLPLDNEKPLQVVIREAVDVRSIRQNKLYHTVLHNIADQLWLNGRKFDKTTWEVFMKQQFLPECVDEKITSVNYKKWTWLPTGDRILVGSTTELKVLGMTRYMDEIIKFAAENGVVITDEE